MVSGIGPGGCADQRAAFELVDHHFAEGEFLRFGRLTQAPRGGEAILMEERAALDDRRCGGIGVDIGDRTPGTIGIGSSPAK